MTKRYTAAMDRCRAMIARWSAFGSRARRAASAACSCSFGVFGMVASPCGNGVGAGFRVAKALRGPQAAPRLGPL